MKQPRRALLIGINDYDHFDKLKNACKDAEDLAVALKRLDFEVDCLTDVDDHTYQERLDDFIRKCTKETFCLFFFSGHGLEIKGNNYLVLKNAPFPKDEIGVNSTARYSIKIQDDIESIVASGCNPRVFILDCCRTNPIMGDKGIGSPINLTHIKLPQESLIAYSTSPGMPASDGKDGDRNSIFTKALLEHLKEKNLTIEELFKRVRATVYRMSSGRQITWEHTSLIGTYYLNNGQMEPIPQLKYSQGVICDSEYDRWGNPIVGEILDLFLSYNYYNQKDGLGKFEGINAKELSRDELFVIGRNILQAAQGGCWECQRFINDSAKIGKYIRETGPHLLNGILYEMYFNGKGKFRIIGFKTDMLSDILKQRKNPLYAESLQFIFTQLTPYADSMMFVPGVDVEDVRITINFDEEPYIDLIDEETLILNEINYNGENITDMALNRYKTQWNSLEELKSEIAHNLSIPETFLILEPNMDTKGRKLYRNKDSLL